MKFDVFHGPREGQHQQRLCNMSSTTPSHQIAPDPALTSTQIPPYRIIVWFGNGSSAFHAPAQQILGIGNDGSGVTLGAGNGWVFDWTFWGVHCNLSTTGPSSTKYLHTHGITFVPEPTSKIIWEPRHSQFSSSKSGAAVGFRLGHFSWSP